MGPIRVRVSSVTLVLYHGRGRYVSHDRLDRFVTRTRQWFRVHRREIERWRLEGGRVVQISRGEREREWQVDWVRQWNQNPTENPVPADG